MGGSAATLVDPHDQAVFEPSLSSWQRCSSDLYGGIQTHHEPVIGDSYHQYRNNSFFLLLRIIIIWTIDKASTGDNAMIKTISFAIMHFSVAFGVAYALTGDLVIGGAIALIEPAVNTVGYYFHEKVWAWVRRPKDGDYATPLAA